MKIREGGLAVLLALVALPASAYADSSVALSDGCGDAHQTLATVGDNAASVPFDSKRSPQYDIDGASITALPDGGVQAQMKTCGPITAPELYTGAWQVSADAGNDDSISFSVSDDSYGAPTRTATVTVWHTSVSKGPVLNQTIVTSTKVYEVTLPASAWSIQGDTVTWQLNAARLHATHAGSTWTGPFASTRDGARVTETWHEGVYSVNGPGVTDNASGTGTLDLG
jgi:hypothetical protein